MKKLKTFQVFLNLHHVRSSYTYFLVYEEVFSSDDEDEDEDSKSFYINSTKVNFVFPVAVVSLLRHAEFGRDYHWEDALHTFNCHKPKTVSHEYF